MFPFWFWFWYLFKTPENLQAWFFSGDSKSRFSEWKYLNYTSCSPQQVNFYPSAMVLANLKYQNMLYLQDVTSILFTLKYFDILSLLLAEVSYSFCMITRSKISGDNYTFSWFPNVWQKLYSKGTRKIITVKIFLMCSWWQYPGMLMKLTEA